MSVNAESVLSRISSIHEKVPKISGHCHFKLINTVRSFSAALSLALKGVFSKNRLVGKLYMEAKVNFFIHILLR